MKNALLTLLIADDDQNTRDYLAEYFKKNGFEVLVACNGAEAIRLGSTAAVDLMLLDYQLGDCDAKQVLAAIASKRTLAPTLIMTAYGEVDIAVAFMKLGVKDFIVKPFEIGDICARVRHVADLLKLPTLLKRRSQQQGREALDKIVGVSSAIEQLKRDIVDMALTPAKTLFIAGESGTGKELVARAIHDCSARAQGPFVALNCGAIPENLFESELFGHEKGAFTGAEGAKPGLIEVSNQGTLFLDEIGDLSLPVQVKLLRFLEERRFRRVSGTQEQSVDVRVVAATSRDLFQMMLAEKFRKDLYYRICGIQIEISTLRERPDDIAELAAHFARSIASEFQKPVQGLSADALRKLQGYSFPGNVRELKNMIENAVVFAKGTVITADDIRLLENPHSGSSVSDSSAAGLLPLQGLTTFQDAKAHAVRQFETQFLLKQLEKYGGRVSQAAQAINVLPSVMFRMLKKHNIDARALRDKAQAAG